MRRKHPQASNTMSSSACICAHILWLLCCYSERQISKIRPTLHLCTESWAPGPYSRPLILQLLSCVTYFSLLLDHSHQLTCSHILGSLFKLKKKKLLKTLWASCPSLGTSKLSLQQDFSKERSIFSSKSSQLTQRSLFCSLFHVLTGFDRVSHSILPLAFRHHTVLTSLLFQ